MLRVIAGEHKGRKLLAPSGKSCRPTLDRVKESIFNVLGADVIDRRALDLFCGSGSLGIEALSRGAASATFIDSEKESIEIVKNNLAALGLEKRATYILGDVFKIAKIAPSGNFDLVFADPPYDHQYGERIMALLLSQGILDDGGIFILERFRKEQVVPISMDLLKCLKFGQTEVDFFLRPKENNGRS
jgi:16S rRNA (guanine(966)-N(2))-methyltransferase RsmD